MNCDQDSVGNDVTHATKQQKSRDVDAEKRDMNMKLHVLYSELSMLSSQPSGTKDGTYQSSGAKVPKLRTQNKFRKKTRTILPALSSQNQTQPGNTNNLIASSAISHDHTAHPKTGQPGNTNNSVSVSAISQDHTAHPKTPSLTTLTVLGTDIQTPTTLVTTDHNSLPHAIQGNCVSNTILSTAKVDLSDTVSMNGVQVNNGLVPFQLGLVTSDMQSLIPLFPVTSSVVQTNDDKTNVQTNDDITNVQTNSNSNGVQTKANSNGVQTNTYSNGVQTNININGVQTNISYNGVQTNTYSNGVQTNTNINGVQTNTNINGVQTNTNFDGVQTTNQMNQVHTKTSIVQRNTKVNGVQMNSNDFGVQSNPNDTNMQPNSNPSHAPTNSNHTSMPMDSHFQIVQTNPDLITLVVHSDTVGTHVHKLPVHQSMAAGVQLNPNVSDVRPPACDTPRLLIDD